MAYDDDPSPVLPDESCWVYDSIGYGAAAIRVCLARTLADRPLAFDILPTGGIRGWRYVDDGHFYGTLGRNEFNAAKYLLKENASR